ncbi:MAG: ribonuclease III family protein [Adlercreutzia equolifaciens]
MSLTAEQQTKLERAQKIVGRTFENTQYLLSAITHPSATEGRAVKFSYERLEFLGDSILGALVANAAFHQVPELDEGGLTRIKVASSRREPVEVAEKLGFADVIVFGSSETGTAGAGCTRRSRTSTRPWWRRCSSTAASMRRGPSSIARSCPRCRWIRARAGESQERPAGEAAGGRHHAHLSVGGDPRPPHDRTFVAQVYAGDKGLAQGVGRTKKEAESQAAKSTLARLSEFFGIGMTEEQAAEKAAEKGGARRGEGRHEGGASPSARLRPPRRPPRGPARCRQEEAD